MEKQYLQKRSKWQTDGPQVCVDDVVLLKDSSIARNSWPLTRASKVFPNQVGKVRNVEVTCLRYGKPVAYIMQLVDLLNSSNCTMYEMFPHGNVIHTHVRLFSTNSIDLSVLFTVCNVSTYCHNLPYFMYMLLRITSS